MNKAHKKYEMPQQFRQGDLLFIKRSSMPEGVNPHGSDVLQEGELTGHKHRLVAGDIYEDEAGNLWVKTGESTEVVHEEHDSISFDADSVYEVRRQREVSGEISD